MSFNEVDRAHIMVAVLGKEEDVLEKGKLYTKLVAACCRQKYATGIYTSGVAWRRWRTGPWSW